jgi:hypothetical protein
MVGLRSGCSLSSIKLVIILISLFEILTYLSSYCCYEAADSDALALPPLILSLCYSDLILYSFYGFCDP